MLWVALWVAICAKLDCFRDFETPKLLTDKTDRRVYVVTGVNLVRRARPIPSKPVMIKARVPGSGTPTGYARYRIPKSTMVTFASARLPVIVSTSSPSLIAVGRNDSFMT